MLRPRRSSLVLDLTAAIVPLDRIVIPDTVTCFMLVSLASRSRPTDALKLVDCPTMMNIFKGSIQIFQSSRFHVISIYKDASSLPAILLDALTISTTRLAFTFRLIKPLQVMV